MDAEHRSRVMVLERGDLFFLYRPDVEELTPEGLLDVRRFYMVHHPQGRDLFRLIAIGKKKLPEPGNGGQRHWSFVDGVFATPRNFGEGRLGSAGRWHPERTSCRRAKASTPSCCTATTRICSTPWNSPRSPARSRRRSISITRADSSWRSRTPRRSHLQGSVSKRIVRPFTRTP